MWRLFLCPNAKRPTLNTKRQTPNTKSQISTNTETSITKNR